MIVSGQNPFPHLNMETPSLFNWATENKVLITFISKLTTRVLKLESTIYMFIFW